MKKLPYEKYRNLKAWKVIKKELNELVKNQDLHITTLTDFIIGSIVKCLEENNLLNENKKNKNFEDKKD